MSGARASAAAIELRAAPISKLELPRIGFHNGLAVRVALLAGILAFFAPSSPDSSRFLRSSPWCGWWPRLLRGLLYERRTGQRLSVRSGPISAGLRPLRIRGGHMALAATAVMLSDPSVAPHAEQLRTHGIPAANASR